jgi:hypothetical protein
MKPLLLLLFLLSMQSPGPAGNNEAIIYYRIESVLLIKNAVMEKAWPGTTDAKYEIPFIYYTDSACYVANPTDKFLQLYQCELKYKSGKLVIYKTARIDSIPFRMEVNATFNEADFEYNTPWGKISGLDEVRKYAPTLSPQAWNGMVLHEFFHGYQFHHPQYFKYVFEKKLAYRVINDSLQSYYKTLDWYKKSVDQENDLILLAIDEKDKTKRKDLVVKMFSLRDDRRRRTLQQMDRRVDFYESGFETMEGTARYIEEAVYNNFLNVKFPDELLKIDTIYSNALKKGKPIPDPAGYKTEATMVYTYAIGYNMARLLDKFGCKYKSKLFIEPELTLEKLLRDEVSGR